VLRRILTCPTEDLSIHRTTALLAVTRWQVHERPDGFDGNPSGSRSSRFRLGIDCGWWLACQNGSNSYFEVAGQMILRGLCWFITNERKLGNSETPGRHIEESRYVRPTANGMALGNFVVHWSTRYLPCARMNRSSIKVRAAVTQVGPDTRLNHDGRQPCGSLRQAHVRRFDYEVLADIRQAPRG
jgi:hypothetical protein